MKKLRSQSGHIEAARTLLLPLGWRAKGKKSCWSPGAVVTGKSRDHTGAVESCWRHAGAITAERDGEK